MYKQTHAACRLVGLPIIAKTKVFAVWVLTGSSISSVINGKHDFEIDQQLPRIRKLEIEKILYIYEGLPIQNAYAFGCMAGIYLFLNSIPVYVPPPRPLQFYLTQPQVCDDTTSFHDKIRMSIHDTTHPNLKLFTTALPLPDFAELIKDIYQWSQAQSIFDATTGNINPEAPDVLCVERLFHH